MFPGKEVYCLMLPGLLFPTDAFKMQTWFQSRPTETTQNPQHAAPIRVFVSSPFIFLHPLPSPDLSLLIFLRRVCSLVRGKPSQHVQPFHVAIMTWRNSLGCGHCCLSASTSGFAFSSEFPFTDIMGLNDLLPETLILSSR